jgi:hypothetical protein
MKYILESERQKEYFSSIEAMMTMCCDCIGGKKVK